ncbi:MAG: glycine cleavage system aminomethyltransferase GcvT [Ignavibacteriales bacterium]
MDNLLKTPLFELYEEYGGKVVDFAGWALPVQFSGIIEEHKAVRTNAGLFDVSHMGEILVFGEGATEFLDFLLANDISSLKNGKIRYAHMCNNNGGVVDDILVYKLSFDEYLLVVNASNIEKDFKWIKSKAPNEVFIENVSQQFAQLALQGPKAVEILSKLTDSGLSSMKYYSFERDVFVSGFKCIISRTGYTGEDGFEIYCAPKDAPNLWRKILETGNDFGAVPVGLGARDTLRFEACMPLYGHELDEDITPLEAGLERYVKLDKPDFIGKKALKEQRQNGIPRILIGIEMIERGIPRGGYSVILNQKAIGKVTTGSYCPTANKNLALAFVDVKRVSVGDNGKPLEGQELYIEIREKNVMAKTVITPFYRR